MSLTDSGKCQEFDDQAISSVAEAILKKYSGLCLDCLRSGTIPQRYNAAKCRVRHSNRYN